MPHVRIALGLLAVVATGALIGARFARAEDPRKGMPQAQKPVNQAFVETLVGTWNVETTGLMAVGKGKAAFTKGVGGTALLEDYGKKGDTLVHKMTARGLEMTSTYTKAN